MKEVFLSVETSNFQINSVLSSLQSAPIDNGRDAFEIPDSHRNEERDGDPLLAALDITRVMDIILIVFDGSVDVNDTGIGITNAIRAQELPSIFTLAVGERRSDCNMRK